MTGPLVLSDSTLFIRAATFPQVELCNTTTNRYTYVQSGDDNTTYISNRADADNRQALSLNNENEDLDKALRIVRVKDGAVNMYNIYHEGNKPSPANIGAATKEEVEELKTSVSEGKALIAAAVTDKGVETATDATFQTMANNINNISTTLSFENLTLVGSSEDNTNHPYDSSTTNDSISITIPDNNTYLAVIQTGFHNSNSTAYTNAGSWCGLYIISNQTIISKWDGTVYHHSGNNYSHAWCGVKNNTVTPTLTDGVLTVKIWYEDISWSVFDFVEETMGYFLYKI